MRTLSELEKEYLNFEIQPPRFSGEIWAWITENFEPKGYWMRYFKNVKPGEFFSVNSDEEKEMISELRHKFPTNEIRRQIALSPAAAEYAGKMVSGLAWSTSDFVGCCFAFADQFIKQESENPNG